MPKGFCHDYETRSRKKWTSHNLTQMAFCHGYEAQSKKKRSFHHLTQTGFCHGYETRSRSKGEGIEINRIRSISHKNPSSQSKSDWPPNPTGVDRIKSASADSIKHKKTKKEGSSSSIKMNILSNLSEDMKGQVLSFLPIKEAVRTSTLSKDWRHTWYSLPGLVVYDTEIIFDNNPRNVGYYRLIRTVDSMIVINHGPAHEDNLEDVQFCKIQGSMVNGEVRLECCPLVDFNGLKDIEFLRLNFEDENEAAFVLALLLRASHLQSLVVHVNLPGERETASVAKFWEKVNTRRIEGELGLGLHTVKIVNIKNADSIFSFLRFIISATQLEFLLIGHYLVNSDDHETIIQQMIALRNTSNKTKNSNKTRVIFPISYYSTFFK